MTDIIYGRNAVSEALKSSLDIEKIYMLNHLRGEYEVEVRNLCKENNIPLAKVPEVKLNELTRNRGIHQGVVAIISPVKYTEVEKLVKEALENQAQPFFVIIDGVKDVRNIGAIARSAHFFGAGGIIISGKFSGRISEDTVKASAGAILKLPIARVNSLLTLISDLQSMGIIVVATSLENAVPPTECDFTEPVAFILGSEDTGLHKKVLSIVDYTVKIPAVTDFDSLNVSVAGGILFYETARQRSSK